MPGYGNAQPTYRAGRRRYGAGDYGQAAAWGFGGGGEDSTLQGNAGAAAGAAIGLAVGGPAGAVVGAAAGRAIGEITAGLGAGARGRHKSREARIQATNQEAYILSQLSQAQASTAVEGYGAGFTGGWQQIQRADATRAAQDIELVRETAAARAEAFKRQAKNELISSISSGIEGGAKTLAGGMPT